MSLNSLQSIIERSSAGFFCEFKDEEGELRSPKKILYTLVNEHGQPVNKIERKSFTPVATQVTIIINGDDTQVLETEESKSLVFRRFIVESLYDSSWGSDLSSNQFFDFAIKNSKFIKNAIS